MAVAEPIVPLVGIISSKFKEFEGIVTQTDDRREIVIVKRGRSGREVLVTLTASIKMPKYTTPLGATGKDVPESDDCAAIEAEASLSQIPAILPGIKDNEYSRALNITMPYQIFRLWHCRVRVKADEIEILALPIKPVKKPL
jgi:hypothetical protein